MYCKRVEVPDSKMTEFKLLAIRLQLDVYVELEDGHDNESYFEYSDDDSDTNLTTKLEKKFDRTLSALEASRPYRCHRTVRGRKSLLNYSGPFICDFCPEPPFFCSSRMKTAHEKFCKFNPDAVELLVCDMCGKRFKVKKVIEKHFTAKHLWDHLKLLRSSWSF